MTSVYYKSQTSMKAKIDDWEIEGKKKCYSMVWYAASKVNQTTTLFLSYIEVREDLMNGTLRSQDST